MAKDWTGTAQGMFAMIGASNHCKTEREEHDYYATEPAATQHLLRLEEFQGPILEPSCGQGHISEELKRAGYEVVSRDLVNRGYGTPDCDFLSIDNQEWQGDIITNPPYRYAQEFVEKALQIVPEGRKVAMFLKLQFLEGKHHRALFRAQPPRRVWVSSSRLKCALGGKFEEMTGSAVCYAWYVWEKGYRGDTVLKWFN